MDKLTFSIVISSTAASISFFSSKREFFCCSTLRKMGKRWETFVAAHTQKNLIFADFFQRGPLSSKSFMQKEELFFLYFSVNKNTMKNKATIVHYKMKLVPKGLNKY